MKSLLAVALLAFAVSAGAASASTIQIDYAGVVTNVNNQTEISGYTVGESITGRMVLTLPDTPQRTYMSGVPFFDNYAGTGTSTINGTTISDYGSIVNRSLSSFSDISFGVSETIGGVQYTHGLFFESFNSVPLISSLQNLPLSLAAIKNYLQGPTYVLNGHIYVNEPGAHVWDIDWEVQSLQISAVSQTPIPASLPLFATALAGLGFIGRRQVRHMAIS